MKYTTVTKQNMPLILFRINQFLQRNEVVSHYSDWGRYPKEMNKLGVKNNCGVKFVEKTITGYVIKSKYNIRLDLDYGIVIHTSKDCAIAICLGDKVKVYPNRLVIKNWNIWLKKSSTSYFSPSTDIDKAERELDFENKMSDAYWKDVENEDSMERSSEELESDISKGRL
jgi:hypothetical protein